MKDIAKQLLDKATVVHLQPDDVLLFGNIGTISRESADEIQRFLAEVLPGKKTVLFEQDIDLDLLRYLETQ